MEVSDDVADAARKGDAEAVATVYTILAGPVQSYLRSRGVEDPEGLTSEVFLGVIPRLPALVGGAAGLRTLVFSVAHARAVDDVRRRARRPNQTPYEPDLDARSVDSAEAAAMERSGHAVALLDRLPEEQRMVIGLRVIADLSLEQTAEVLGKSVGAVKQLQRRGLLALRTIAEREGVR